MITLFQHQQNDNELDDVVLQVENEEFPVRRSVISAFSEYFQKMFTIDMKEKYDKVIKIEDVTAEAMKEILKAMYDGEIDFTEDNLAEILHAASLMQVTSVLDVAVEYMNHYMSSEKSRAYLELANLYSLEAVQAKAIQCLLQHFDQISEEESILNLPVHQIETFLQSDYLTTDGEERVFEYILKWVNKDVEKRKQYFPQLFKHVRLQFIPIKYVVATIGEHELVKRFNECRDLVNDAILYYFAPTKSAATKPPRFSPDPDSVLFLPYDKREQFRYNLHTKESRKLSCTGLPIDCSFLKGCAVANKRLVIVLCGGYLKSSWSIGSSKQVLRFNGSTWCKLPSMNDARCGGAAVFHNEKLYVFGGETTPISPSVEFKKDEENPYAEQFAKTFETFEGKCWKYGTWNPDRRSCGAAIAYQNQIYLIGGYKPTSFPGSCSSNQKLCKQACDEVVIYNPASGEWKKSVNMRQARAKFGCALWGSSVYVVGGLNEYNRWSTTAEYRNLDSDQTWSTWTTISKSSSYGAVSDRVLLAGIFCSIEKKMYTFNDGKIYSIAIDFDKHHSSYSYLISEEANVLFYDGGLLIPFNNRYVANSF